MHAPVLLSMLTLMCPTSRRSGCKFTMPYGSPHDREAEAATAAHRAAQFYAVQLQQQYTDSIVDPHEKEWAEMCTDNPHPNTTLPTLHVWRIVSLICFCELYREHVFLPTKKLTRVCCCCCWWWWWWRWRRRW
jgi:hypothetical protein